MPFVPSPTERPAPCAAVTGLPPDSPAHDLQEALARVVRLLVFGHYDPQSPLAELPIAQLRCLHVISRHEGQKMQELADTLAVKLSTLSQIVERLVQRGMVERHPDPSDRRVVRLRLTGVAQNALAAAGRARQARLLAASEALTDEERAQVVAGLRLLGGAAEKSQPGERHPADPGAGAASPDAGDPLVELMARRPRRAAPVGTAAGRGPVAPKKPPRH